MRKATAFRIGYNCAQARITILFHEERRAHILIQAEGGSGDVPPPEGDFITGRLSEEVKVLEAALA